MKIRAFILVFFYGLISLGQELKDLRHWVTDEHSSDFYILLEEKKIKFADTLDYYWFKSQVIHVTQGYASGHLLNGPFTKFYVSGQLAESGEFQFGLRVGEWKTWFESGQLQSIYNYDKGVLDGNYFKYDDSGTIIESGNYRSGKYHGEKIENGEITKYRNGKERKRKDKPVKEEEEKVKDDEKAGEKKENRWFYFFRKKENNREEKKKKEKKAPVGNSENDREKRDRKNKND